MKLLHLFAVALVAILQCRVSESCELVALQPSVPIRLYVEGGGVREECLVFWQWLDHSLPPDPPLNICYGSCSSLVKYSVLVNTTATTVLTDTGAKDSCHGHQNCCTPTSRGTQTMSRDNWRIEWYPLSGRPWEESLCRDHLYQGTLDVPTPIGCHCAPCHGYLDESQGQLLNGERSLPAQKCEL